MFKVGDLVIAKPEFLDPKETLLDTAGIVVEYNPDNDYLGVGVLNPEDYVLPPIFSGRGSCYEVVPVGSSLSYEIEAYELKKKREKIQKALMKKQEEFNAINQQIREAETKEAMETLKAAGIRKGSCFIGFSKSLDYHCLFIKLIKVKEISATGKRIVCVEGNYRIDDGDYSFSVSKANYTMNTFAHLTESFDLISISDVVYTSFTSHLVDLDITIENADNFKKNLDCGKKVKLI